LRKEKRLIILALTQDKNWDVKTTPAGLNEEKKKAIGKPDDQRCHRSNFWPKEAECKKSLKGPQEFFLLMVPAATLT